MQGRLFLLTEDSVALMSLATSCRLTAQRYMRQWSSKQSLLPKYARPF